MKSAGIFLLAFVSMVTAAGNSPAPKRFQADKFLDMLGKSFDPKTAYVDLLSALHQRMNLDLISNTNASSSTVDAGSTNVNAMAETSSNCQEAPPRTGAAITYNSNNRALGSRAFYQCEAGYSGRSKFIQCGHGGQWSSLTEWEGCTPVDCGPVPPSVQHSDASFSSTTFGSMVLYSCQTGYKMNSPNANVTCTDTGKWETPTFVCEKGNAPAIGPDNMEALQSLFGGGGGQSNPVPNTNNNPMMAALLKNLPGMPGAPSLPNLGLADNPSVLPSTINNNNNNNNPNPMAAMFAQMFPNFALPSPKPPATTPTATTAKPSAMPGGFQLPSHLQSLLPNGLSSTSGMRPQDLMTLASVGLGSSHPAAAPRDLSQLLGTMNPMSFLGGAMGMHTGGAGAGAGAAAAVPPDPERAAEQREEMMMRALMATTMKSMMGGAKQGNSSNPAMDMMTLMALQSGLGGAGGSGLGAGAGAAGMDPLGMMFGMGAGGASGGLFSNLFGA